MFLIFTQHAMEDGKRTVHDGLSCACDMEKVVAFGTDVEDDGTTYTKLLFENKETLDVREPVQAIVTLLMTGPSRR